MKVRPRRCPAGWVLGLALALEAAAASVLKDAPQLVKPLHGEFTLKKRYMEQRGMNAQLMLEVQALKGNIQVCCRIRPFNGTEKDRGDEAAVEFITETEVGVVNLGVNDWETYGFDQVWHQMEAHTARDA